LGQYARDIIVDVYKAVGAIELGQLQIGKIHTHNRIARVDKANNFRGYELSNIFLGFLGISANMRCNDCIRQMAQLTIKSFLII